MPRHHTASKARLDPGDYGLAAKPPSRRQIKRRRAKAIRQQNHQLEQELTRVLDAMDRDGTLDLTVATLNTVAGPTREKA